jgi:hypothetical protein
VFFLNRDQLGAALAMASGITSLYGSYIRAEAERLRLRVPSSPFDRGIRIGVLAIGLIALRPLYSLVLTLSLSVHAALIRTLSVAIPAEPDAPKVDFRAGRLLRTR